MSARHESPTWDETHYLGLGEYLLQTGRWDVPGSILHPPLSFYLGSLPIRASDLNWDLFARPVPATTDPGYLDFLGTADVGRSWRVRPTTATRSSPTRDS